ncbi:glycosyltransferase [Gemella sp. GH3]|uniref:glycosyltransferase n=1 Tax=unclassified Gemella TaxID=2624949 RepID=UPI0015CFF382|nr:MULTISPECIES: glycosyltransferase [unclassified Gemella]MBF0713644.1 glycosyltransferase [Gemella sp. GH3.1]NYS50596.1 glycosyltransferase [Gemella sp. GH3]
MSNTKLVSIIVPVYNVEKYLEKCVNSIINQSYENIEIILVNDGSTDSSGTLCNDLARKDNRIKVYHKENGGLSDARNYGVARASGDYIGFVDSDDYIHEDMYKHLYEIITESDADVAECSFLIVYNDKPRSYYSSEDYCLTLTKEEYLKEYLSMERIYGAVCWKLIKSEVARKIEFPKDKFYEDAFYTYELIEVANKYAITNKELYYYIMRDGSITNMNFNKKHLDNIKIAEKFVDYVSNNYPNLLSYAKSKEMYSYFSVFNKILELDNYTEVEEYEQIKKYFVDNRRLILKNNVISKNRKLSAFIISLNVRLYKQILKFYKGKISQ